MSDAPWQVDDLMAPKDRSAVAFAPWFQAPPKEKPVAAFQHWDLKREAALERERQAALAAQEAAAAAEALRAAHVEQAPPPPATQALSEAELAQIREQAHAQGVAEGREAARAEWAQERAQQAVVVQDLLTQWAGFRANTAGWFEPLKRLALAVGEQLARAHVALHPEAVQQLVEQCAQALGESREQVMVHLNPDDLTRLQGLDVRWPDDWQWVADARMGVGSVRLSTRDTEVEDLMTHRLSVLAQQLLDPHLPQVDPDATKPEPAHDADDQGLAASTASAAASPEAAPSAPAQAVLPRSAPSSMTERAAQAEGVEDVEPVMARASADVPQSTGDASTT